MSDLPDFPNLWDSLLPFPKTKFCDQMQDGDVFDDVFLVDDVREKLKKNGGSYWNVVLRDRTGTVEAKVWDGTEAPFKKGDFVKVRAQAETYREKIQLNLKKFRALNVATETVNVEDFVPVGPFDRFKQVKNLQELIEQYVKHPGLRAVCLHVFEDPALHMAFRDAPAAKSNHQPYVGGLVEHVLQMADLAVAICSAYQFKQNDRVVRNGTFDEEGFIVPWYDGRVDRELLIAACLLHDIGKIKELVWKTYVGYSVEGQVIGHVGIGMEMLAETFKPVYWKAMDAELISDGALIRTTEDDVKKFDAAKEKWTHLRHLIASHHGNLEWRAISKPMTREAMLFHLIDMIDSHMGGFDVLDKQATDADGIIAWDKKLGGPGWRPNA